MKSTTGFKTNERRSVFWLSRSPQRVARNPNLPFLRIKLHYTVYTYTQNKANVLLPLDMQTLKALQLHAASPPNQGLCSWTPLGLHSRPHYRLVPTFLHPSRPMVRTRLSADLYTESFHHKMKHSSSTASVYTANKQAVLLT